MSKVDVVLIKPNDKKNIYGTLPGEYTAIDPPWWLAVMGGVSARSGVKCKSNRCGWGKSGSTENSCHCSEMETMFGGCFTSGE